MKLTVCLRYTLSFQYMASNCLLRTSSSNSLEFLCWGEKTNVVIGHMRKKHESPPHPVLRAI